MSKKSKKSQQQKSLIEELPSKSQCKMLSETLDKNHMDHTQYLLFIPEDFENLNSRSLDDEQTPILERMASDFNNLLHSSPIVFWSTCSYNSYFQKSLDSFLKHAKKPRFSPYIQASDCDLLRKNPSQELFVRKDHGFLEWMQEIYRLIFLIYSRMSTRKELEGKEINVSSIVFENWLFDTTKALDLIAIYGCEDGNKDALRKIIQGFFEINKEYHDDFYNTLIQIKKICDKSLCNLVDIKKREKLLGGESRLDAEDIDNRYANLVNLLDFSYLCNDLLLFFPVKCRETLVLDEKIALLCENLYYEAENYRGFLKQSLKKDFEPLISQILRNQALYFQRVFAFFVESLENKYINESNSKKFCGFLQKMLSNFGKMMFGMKKDPLNLSLLRHLARLGFDLAAFVAKLPSFMDIFAGNSSEQLSLVLATFESLKEELKAKDCGTVEQDSESSAGETDEKPQENQENTEKKQEIQGDAQLQQRKDERNEEKIQYTEIIVGKKEREIEKLDEIARKEAAEFIKQQMLEYEDEYDDTLEIYNDTRLIVEKNQLDPDSEEEVANFDQENEYNDEKNDDFEGSYQESREKKAFYPKKDYDSYGYSQENREKEDLNKRNYNNNYHYQKKYNEKEDKSQYNQNKNAGNNYNYYNNKGGYTKYYEKKGEVSQENEEKTIHEDNESENNNKNSRPNKTYHDPKRKYNQDKAFKSKATYKRKY